MGKQEKGELFNQQKLYRNALPKRKELKFSHQSSSIKSARSIFNTLCFCNISYSLSKGMIDCHSDFVHIIRLNNFRYYLPFQVPSFSLSHISYYFIFHFTLLYSHENLVYLLPRLLNAIHNLET